MNTSSKITFGAGAIMLVIGILATIMGANAWGGIDGWMPTDDVYKEIPQDDVVSFVHVENGNGTSVAVFVNDYVKCDEFTLEIEGGDAFWKPDLCQYVDGRSLPSGYEDDPEGWLHLGMIEGLEDGVEYSITTNHDVVLVGWEVIDEIIGDFLGGLAGLCGGPTFLCCGLFLLAIGGLITVTSPTPKKTVIEIENIEPGNISTYQK